MIDLEEAQSRWLNQIGPLETEIVLVSDASGCFLAHDVTASLTQPPFPAASMDGYAIRFADLPGPWRIVGEAAAGGAFSGRLKHGQAVRIFTGAPLPDGADTVVVQEDTARDGDDLHLTGDGPPHEAAHVRHTGQDFAAGDIIARAGARVTPALIGLLAAAGHGYAPVHRRPRVALIATGSELVPPGITPGPSQIVNANGAMLAALFRQAGAEVRDLGIVPDDLDALVAAIASAAGSDLIVTIGGVSVGDHDLVAPALTRAGATIDVWKVALRPGKPVMTGALGACRLLGLPGNPVSAYVCAILFGLPMCRALAGDPSPLPHTALAATAVALPANGPRRHFMRASVEDDIVTPADFQDSALLGVLAASNALLVRDANASPVAAGEQVVIIPLDSARYGP